jgi:hypothetical protein
MNVFDSAIDIAVIGGWVDRPAEQERSRDARYLLVETSLVIEAFLADEPSNASLRFLQLFIESNMQALQRAEMEKQS